MASRVGLVYDERMCAHENVDSDDHPEQPARITSIYQRLKAEGVVDRCVQVDAREATPAELSTVHTEDHISLMQELGHKSFGKKKRRRLQETFDSIYFNEGSAVAALLAAGSVIEVATQVAEGKLASGACVIRPPGHHAEADRPMGFCLLNNVAVAAHILAHEKTELGVKKVLIVDWDVHHGNGTQHMFWTDPQVMYFSVHRFDQGRFYPPGNDGNCTEVGGEEGKGYNINVPWPNKDYGDADYLAVWKYILMPVARQFNPDIVLISAGFDSARGDPLGRCNVTPGGYFQMTRQLMELANGRVVLALEGGYNLTSISESYLACMQAMLGDSPVLKVEHDLLPETFPVIKEVRKHLQMYWPILAEEPLPVPFTPAPSLASKELEGMVIESLDEDQQWQTPPQPAIIPITDLIDLLSKLRAWDGSSDIVHDEPTSSTVITSDEKGKKIISSGELSFAGISGPEDIATVLQLSGADSSSFAGEGDGGAVEDEVATGRMEVESEFLRSPSGTMEGIVNTKAGKEEWNALGSTRKIVQNMDESRNELNASGIDSYRNVSSDLSSSEEASGAGDIVEPSYMWYACYGSNMWRPRFMCYIQGGKVEGMSRTCIGCRDKSPPLASEWLSIPSRLFFGHESTKMWGLGGVAFIDPVPEAGILTHVRIYKITMEQFNDVLSQENPGRVERSWMTGRHIAQLKKESRHFLDIFEDEWYGTVKYLGEKDGLPILTFTCPESHMKKFRSGEFGTFAPPESYRNVIVHGLVEDLGLTEEQAHDYVSSAILPK
ncbi:histone deacetylase 5 isoform X2 [Physcomitrium patens]|uniref:histone deacetylase n=1 Tax=Physcomitrium patens TaxID=3218 RepID=A0A7I4ARY4_PHYPA|nr:histone deacetylase 5-like isoform X2 [Physcomitrium patens]|eukprot:XP_024395263.1 histone deacetylase 5-like isoform X2 [Physcomitrella patens]